MYFLARVLDGDLEGFAEQYGPVPESGEVNQRDTLTELLSELEAAERGVVSRLTSQI